MSTINVRGYKGPVRPDGTPIELPQKVLKLTKKSNMRHKKPNRSRVCDVPMALAGFPSTDYAAHTVVTHLFDYGFTRFEMGYASAIATLLFLVMILCNKLIQSALRRIGT